MEVFGHDNGDEDPTNDLIIPIIPTFGNNDILPHNIITPGPNKWLQEYANIWRKFIPEDQRHGFQRGGWFWVEVIPNKLAVFSLNTLFFFDRNAAVDGCALKSEPGWEHLEWLRIQLQFLRQRGLKAILTGHVPPARTDSKQLWDETCWQKYTLWLRQYRDVVITGVYGHMNIDHFLIQDTNDVDLTTFGIANRFARSHLDDELNISSAADYLVELRDGWSKLPDPSRAIANKTDNARTERKKGKKGRKDKKSKKDKALKEMGGPWGERFQLSMVGPSVVPNYFPTLRVIEYNVTGLENNPVWAESFEASQDETEPESLEEKYLASWDQALGVAESFREGSDASVTKKKNKHKKPKKPKSPKNPNLNIPPPPSKSSPPGPAYSPQTLTLLGYTQYFANLTHINNDTDHPKLEDSTETSQRREGKHKDKRPKHDKPVPNKFNYEVEYSTFNDSLFGLEDMTVRSYLKLAHRIGQYKRTKGWNDKHIKDEDGDVSEHGGIFSELINDVSHAIDHYLDILSTWLADETHNDEMSTEKGGKGHKKRRKNEAWLAFIKRAFVGTLNDEEMEDFLQAREMSARAAAEELEEL